MQNEDTYKLKLLVILPLFEMSTLIKIAYCFFSHVYEVIPRLESASLRVSGPS